MVIVALQTPHPHSPDEFSSIANSEQHLSKPLVHEEVTTKRWEKHSPSKSLQGLCPKAHDSNFLVLKAPLQSQEKTANWPTQTSFAIAQMEKMSRLRAQADFRVVKEQSPSLAVPNTGKLKRAWLRSTESTATVR